MFDRAVGSRVGAATAAVRAAGFGATERPVLRPAVDAAAQPAGFDRVVTPRVSVTMAPPVAAALETPIEVLFKPPADYTDEARTLRIQGEVVVEAAFGPSGEVSVVRVVQRLGHGLDETATRAVSGIRFRPATRDGVPVTVRTFVHIEFRLT
jgi:TonB family protein